MLVNAEDCSSKVRPGATDSPVCDADCGVISLRQKFVPGQVGRGREADDGHFGMALLDQRCVQQIEIFDLELWECLWLRSGPSELVLRCSLAQGPF
jgi:hypothetical protein